MWFTHTYMGGGGGGSDSHTKKGQCKPQPEPQGRSILAVPKLSRDNVTSRERRNYFILARGGRDSSCSLLLNRGGATEEKATNFAISTQ